MPTDPNKPPADDQRPNQDTEPGTEQKPGQDDAKNNQNKRSDQEDGANPLGLAGNGPAPGRAGLRAGWGPEFCAGIDPRM